MRCPNCQNEIHEDVLYCPHCGLKIERCPSCSSILHKNANFCSHCGRSIVKEQMPDRLGGYYQPLHETQKQTDSYYTPFDDAINEDKTSFKDIEVNNKVNKKVILLSILALILATGLGGWYLLKTGDINPFTEPKDKETQSVVISGDNLSFTTIANLNQGGHVALYKDRIYMCDEKGYLVSMDTSMQDLKTLTSHKVEYVQVVDDVIYYVNDLQQLCRMNIDGTSQEVLLTKEVYYPVVYKEKIYYQSDDEGERLHVYDLKLNEDKELNQRITYNINVTDSKIYYTSTDGIYCIGIDGKGEEKLSSDTAYSLVLKDNTYLYYSTSDYIVKRLDVTSLKTETVIEETSSFMNMTEDYIFYLSQKGLQKYDIKTKQTKTIYTINVNYCEVIGDKLLITTTDERRIVIDFDGQNEFRPFITSDENFV